MELEKVSNKVVETKKALTQEQAFQRILELESELRAVYVQNPNTTNWLWNYTNEGDDAIRGNSIYKMTTENFPLLPRVNNSKSHLGIVAKLKKKSRYAFSAGVALSVIPATVIVLHPTAWLVFAPAIFLSIVTGTIVGVSSSLKLYDGSKKHPIRHILASLFLGKNSKEIIEHHRSRVEKFEFVKSSYEALVGLVRRELKADNLLEIANQLSGDKGTYIAFLGQGKFARVTKEKYLELKKLNEKTLTKEKILELTNGLIYQKLEVLKQN